MLCAVAAIIVQTQQLHAKCGALPSIAPLVQGVEALASLSNPTEIRRATQSLNLMQSRLDRVQITNRLVRLGYEREITDVMAFKAMLSELSAQTRHIEIKALLKSTRFQRTYRRIRNLVEELCLENPSSQTTSYTTNSYAVLDSLLEPRGWSALSPLVLSSSVLSLLLLAVFGLVSGARLRRKRLEREKRHSKRHPCNIPVNVTVNGTMSSHYLVDISRSGANIKNELALPDGTFVHLNFGEITITGKVVWGNSKFAGVRFNKVLPQNAIDTALRTLCNLT